MRVPFLILRIVECRFNNPWVDKRAKPGYHMILEVIYMKRIPLADRQLPDYTRGEEIFNMVSHIVGGGVGVVALALCVVVAALHGSTLGVVSGAIFGASMILLYTVSSVYHGLKPHLTAKKVLQIIDHCTIYLLIAGTYTPIMLCALRPVNPRMSWIIFALVWGLAIVGIVFNAIDLRRYRVPSMICYLAMGWCVVVAMQPTLNALGVGGSRLLVAGGVLYTVGAVFYMFGKKARYIHSVFHLFVLFGSICHCLCIILYVL